MYGAGKDIEIKCMYNHLLHISYSLQSMNYENTPKKLFDMR